MADSMALALADAVKAGDQAAVLALCDYLAEQRAAPDQLTHLRVEKALQLRQAWAARWDATREAFLGTKWAAFENALKYEMEAQAAFHEAYESLDAGATTAFFAAVDAGRLPLPEDLCRRRLSLLWPEASVQLTSSLAIQHGISGPAQALALGKAGCARLRGIGPVRLGELCDILSRRGTPLE